MDSHMDTWSLSMWVSPFRDPWITGYLLLPTAFRSLSRLSSALSAKASTLRSFQLNLSLSHDIALSCDASFYALAPVFCAGIPPPPEPLSGLVSLPFPPSVKNEDGSFTSDVFSLCLDLQYSVFKVQCLLKTFDCFISH